MRVELRVWVQSQQTNMHTHTHIFTHTLETVLKSTTVDGDNVNALQAPAIIFKYIFLRIKRVYFRCVAYKSH